MIDKLALIYIKDLKILAARSRGRDLFYIPGGKREVGESDEDALVREISEELSISLTPSLLEFYGEFLAQAHGQPEGVMVRLRCYTTSERGEVQAAAEIDDVAWLSYAERPKVSPAAQLLFDDLFGKGLIK
ncbi:NUDIX domain-containing protein [Dyadobacter sp. CY261]|uniref:NUDIX hydrolase n=1 Tax=Dyadobacter sp. CY261 TaxID=2907203 RepID=UPI001F467700|nr:NUDIX domain-containing protein [Dyadobacter sp. CY261]MCF0069872.1 NUDIX domain-containing protein [Dyadobacter sp. CY261]